MDFYSETPLSYLIHRADTGDWRAASELAYMFGDLINYPHPEVTEYDQAEAES